MANFWYQNWSVHGLREEKHVDLNTKQFVAIHNNKFVHRYIEKNAKIGLFVVYVGDGAPDIEVMEINGKKLKSKDECERIRENLEEKKKKIRKKRNTKEGKNVSKKEER